ncbi:hypothetical protein DM01DRAFT_355949 [Hesseltinella vesiculosa]|uniref:Uncharacterized protein n=1 Tax=Hesseltinella vesiculosa TaxID=101127 RepID=A0A1X2GU90_9FUNG|nr:hypothetical protein DM01DRAFT_355949 [Hesseltinella vesiculosa]
MTEPHPRLIQSDPAVSDVAPLARCSDCKCKRYLPEFEGRRCWYRTCKRCRSSGTRQRSPPAEAMIQWNDLTEVYSQFSNSVVLPLNIYLPDDLASMPEDCIIRHVITHVYEVTGFEFYLEMISYPSRRSAIALYASCINSSSLQQQIPERTLRRLHDRMQSLERYYRCEDNALRSANRLLQLYEANNFGQLWILHHHAQELHQLTSLRFPPLQLFNHPPRHHKQPFLPPTGVTDDDVLFIPPTIAPSYQHSPQPSQLLPHRCSRPPSPENGQTTTFIEIHDNDDGSEDTTVQPTRQQRRRVQPMQPTDGELVERLEVFMRDSRRRCQQRQQERGSLVSDDHAVRELEQALAQEREALTHRLQQIDEEITQHRQQILRSSHRRD